MASESISEHQILSPLIQLLHAYTPSHEISNVLYATHSDEIRIWNDLNTVYVFILVMQFSFVHLVVWVWSIVYINNCLHMLKFT